MATVKSTAKAAQKATVSAKTNSPATFMFNKENYVLMIAGVVVIVIGFLLMLGKNNTDPNHFNAEEIYSFRRITLAPLVVMIGFGIEVFAILKKSSQE
ncbi:MAG TPA: DUF3098 domain-containing protein [Chitinophagales bacterium]